MILSASGRSIVMLLRSMMVSFFRASIWQSIESHSFNATWRPALSCSHVVVRGLSFQYAGLAIGSFKGSYMILNGTISKQKMKKAERVYANTNTASLRPS